MCANLLLALRAIGLDRSYNHNADGTPISSYIHIMKACRTHAGYRGAFPCWHLQEGSERDAYLDLRLVTSQFSTPYHQ